MESSEGEGSRAEMDLGQFMFYSLDEAAFLDEEVASSSWTQPATVYDHPKSHWEVSLQSHTPDWNPDKIFKETVQWLEQDLSDEDECMKNSEDTDSYFMNSLSPDEEHFDLQSYFLDTETIPNDVEKNIHDEVKNQLKEARQIQPLQECKKNEEPLNYDTSPEASVLHMLQNASVKLHQNTRLCLRDSLYRLADNASRRQTNDSPSRLEEETSTNAIDRIVVSLLYYKQVSTSEPPTSSVTSLSNTQDIPQQTPSNILGTKDHHKHQCPGYSGNSYSVNMSESTSSKRISNKRGKRNQV